MNDGQCVRVCVCMCDIYYVARSCPKREVCHRLQACLEEIKGGMDDEESRRSCTQLLVLIDATVIIDSYLERLLHIYSIK